MASPSSPLLIIVVCTGSICRSPTSEVVLRDMAAAAGLREDALVVAARGTHAHVGWAPDRRSQRAALRRGYDLSALQSRQLVARDYEEADLLIALDSEHRDYMRAEAPARHAHKIRLAMDFAVGRPETSVPDPYYESEEAFELVVDMVEESCEGLLRAVKAAIARGVRAVVPLG